MSLLDKPNSSFVVRIKGFVKNLFFGFTSLVKRFCRIFSVMSKIEKISFWLLVLVMIVLISIKADDIYKAKTQITPASGGIYREAMVGEVKYLNPVLTSSDAERGVSSLLFTGLLKFDKDNSISSDLASDWQISPDKLTYTFTLKPNAVFHDGTNVTAKDVAYTVETIQDPNFKSPLYDLWKDVKVTTESDSVVSFTLPKIYGPFIYQCDFGILPSYMSPDEFSKKLIGTGPYKYTSLKKIGDKISSLKLQKNDQFYGDQPYIQTIEFDLFTDKAEAVANFADQDFSALSGATMSDNGIVDLSFSTPKRLALIANLRNERLKNKDFRQKIFGDQSFPEKTKISLTTIDSPLQKEKAEELKDQFSKKNIDLTIKYFKPTEIQTVLGKKDYELLLYGFDFKHDRDPYLFWHTTQLDKMNFAGYSDKNTDILLEDARMITDEKERNLKYDQIFDTIKNEYLAVFYEPIKFNFEVSNKIKGTSNIKGDDAGSRFFDFSKWYIVEKRVKK